MKTCGGVPYLSLSLRKMRSAYNIRYFAVLIRAVAHCYTLGYSRCTQSYHWLAGPDDPFPHREYRKVVKFLVVTDIGLVT